MDRIAAAARELLPDCEVYVFGSVVEKKHTGGSDVDVLIVSDFTPRSGRERGCLLARLEELAGLPLYHPFEIHLVNREEAKWYFAHMRKYVKVLSRSQSPRRE